MKSLDILEYLSRDDKFFLGSGGKVIWTSTHPMFIDKVGFWDFANFYDYRLFLGFTCSFVDNSGEEIVLKLLECFWPPHI